MRRNSPPQNQDPIATIFNLWKNVISQNEPPPQKQEIKKDDIVDKYISKQIEPKLSAFNLRNGQDYSYFVISSIINFMENNNIKQDKIIGKSIRIKRYAPRNSKNLKDELNLIQNSVNKSTTISEDDKENLNKLLDFFINQSKPEDKLIQPPYKSETGTPPILNPPPPPSQNTKYIPLAERYFKYKNGVLEDHFRKGEEEQTKFIMKSIQEFCHNIKIHKNYIISEQDISSPPKNLTELNEKLITLKTSLETKNIDEEKKQDLSNFLQKFINRNSIIINQEVRSQIAIFKVGGTDTPSKSPNIRAKTDYKELGAKAILDNNHIWRNALNKFFEDAKIPRNIIEKFNEIIENKCEGKKGLKYTNGNIISAFRECQRSLNKFKNLTDEQKNGLTYLLDHLRYGKILEILKENPHEYFEEYLRKDEKGTEINNFGDLIDLFQQKHYYNSKKKAPNHQKLCDKYAQEKELIDSNRNRSPRISESIFKKHQLGPTYFKTVETSFKGILGRLTSQVNFYLGDTPSDPFNEKKPPTKEDEKRFMDEVRRGGIKVKEMGPPPKKFEWPPDDKRRDGRGGSGRGGGRR